MANLLSNSDFELGTPGSPTSWLKYWSGTSGTYTYPVEPGYGGIGKCISISSSSYGDTKWYQGVTGLSASKKYTLSGYLKTSGVSGDGANISIDWFSVTDVWLGWDYVVVKTGTNDWAQYTKTLTPPANAVKANILCALTYSSGTAYFDNMNFSESLQLVNISMTETNSVSLARTIKKSLTISETNSVSLVKKILKSTFAISETNSVSLVKKILLNPITMTLTCPLTLEKFKKLLQSINISLTNTVTLTKIPKKIITITENVTLSLIRIAKKRISDIILRKKHIYNLTLRTIYKYGDIMETDSTWVIEALVKDLFGNLCDAQTITVSIYDPTGAIKVTDAAMTKTSTGIYQYLYDIPLAGPKGKYWTAKVKTTDVSAKIERDTLYEEVI